jgi:hypothetical protein
LMAAAISSPLSEWSGPIADEQLVGAEVQVCSLNATHPPRWRHSTDQILPRALADEELFISTARVKRRDEGRPMACCRSRRTGCR